MPNRREIPIRMKKHLNLVVMLLVSAVLLILSMSRALADAFVTFELLASFDYPGSTSTQPYGINDNGDVAGLCYPPGDKTAGFVRYKDGTFSDLIVAPPRSDNNTYVFDINNVGTICGYFTDGGNGAAFLISGSSYTEVNLPCESDQLTGVNDAGDFCGHSINPGFESFVSIGGTLTNFKVPGSVYTDVEGINNLGQCVGNYQARNNHHFSFRRNADGTLKYPIGDRDTFLHGINDHGEMVGLVDYAQGFRFHGIFCPSPNQSFTYDYPGAEFTWFHGINNRRLICGTYFADGAYHGFIVRVRPSADE
jgi:hypothetical protein